MTELSLAGTAALVGAISAISLPLGSVLGLVWRPRASVSAAFAAFGAGALLAALSLELVAPAVEEATMGHDGGRMGVVALIIGAALGGVTFVVLDKVIEVRGGFLRKASTAMAHFARRRRDDVHAMLHDLCTVSLLRSLPPERVALLVRDVTPVIHAAGEVLFSEDDIADSLVFVRSGRVTLLRGDEPLRTLGPGDVIGEVALLTTGRREVTARADTHVETLVLARRCFERWRRECPELDAAVRALASEHLTEIAVRDAARDADQRAWTEAASRALHIGAEVPSPTHLRAAKDEHPGAPLAIWLGMLLDGVPESLVLGYGVLALAETTGGPVGLASVIPYTFVAGLFLSNFPEAMSSSVTMREQGWSVATIVTMWTGLLVVTTVTAGIGAMVGSAVPHLGIAGMEGMAVGATLTVVASTMIPEAVHLGGRTSVGLSFLAGFFVAVAFTLLE